MTENQKIAGLTTLIETDLFARIISINDDESMKKEEKNKKIKDAVNSFLQGLPNYLQEIPNIQYQVKEILKKTNKNYIELKKMQKKNDIERTKRNAERVRQEKNKRQIIEGEER